MKHHHSRNFAYTFAGLTLTYVSAVLAFVLVTGLLQKNQAVETYATVINSQTIDSDLNKIDSDFAGSEANLDPEDLSDDDDVLGVSNDGVEQDVQSVDQELNTNEEQYNPASLDN